MDIAGISRIGDRPVNEDFTGYAEKDGYVCLALADGLGGHGYGEIASKTAVNAVIEKFKNDGNYPGFMADAVNCAQQKIIAAQKLDFRFSDMRTTITLLLIGSGKAQWLHVGDSRIYMFRNGKILSCTSDHSVPGMLVKTGEIKFKQIRKHADRNKLLRVLGQPEDENEVRYELSKPVRLIRGDAFLLCSDGYWECIDEAHMLRCLKKTDSAYGWIELMNAIVDENGAKIKMDNNSAAAVIYK